MIKGQNLNKVENLYDTVAKEYAETFSGEHEKKPKDQEILQRFSREIGDRRPVWDFGCGPGQTTKYLKNLGIEISGLDLSEKILEQARTIHPKIRFRKGNILELEFGNDSIAGVVAFYAIVHFTEEQVGTAFREVFRVLQPGGIFLFTYHIGKETIHLDEFLGKKVDIDFMFFTTDFISSCLKDRGFGKIEIIEREPYPGVEYESRRAYVFAIKPVVPNPIQIEAATEQDLGQILELQKKAFHGQALIYNDFNLPPLTQTIDEIKNEFRHKNIYKVQMHGRIIASIRCYIKDDTLFIEKLFVDPVCQNKGIGTTIMTEIEKRYALSVKRYALFTGHKSEKNLHIYRKLRYKEVRQETIRNDLKLIYMEKPNEIWLTMSKLKQQSQPAKKTITLT